MALTKIPSSLLDTSGGITLGDSEKALFGAGSDLQIYHDGSHSYIDDQGTGRLYVKASSHITFTNSSGNKVYANFAENGSVGLRYDNDLKIATASTGATVTGDLAVTGDLNITGNVNSASVTDLDVTDKTITLGAGQTEALSGGSGIIIDGSSASILWDETNDTFNINKGLTVGTSNNDLGTTAGNQLTPLTLRSDTANVDSLLFTTKRLSNGNTWTTAAHRIQRKVDSTKMGYIQFGSNTDDLITFGKGNVEYIKIDSSGNVGIGTISPGTDLQIGDGTGSPFITIDKSTTGTSGILLKNAGSNKVKLLSNASEEFELHVNNALAMYVKESGNVGIGTSSPSAKCHLYTAGSEAINLGIQNSQRYWKIETASEKLNIADVSAGGLVRMSFATSGNVGIGTDNPGVALDISTSTANTNGVVRIQNNMDNNYEALRLHSLGNYDAQMSFLAQGDSTYWGAFGIDYSDAGKFKLQTDNLFVGGSTLMTWARDGKVGIGTANPSEMLHINGGGSGPEIRLQNSSGSHYIRAYNDNWNFLANSSKTAITIKNSGNILTPNQTFFSVGRSGNQTFAQTTWVDIVWNSETTDTGGNFASNTFTAPVAGVYLFAGLIGLNTITATGYVLARFACNTAGDFYITHEVKRSGGGDYGYDSAISEMITLAAGETVKIQVFASGGGNHTLRADTRWQGRLMG